MCSYKEKGGKERKNKKQKKQKETKQNETKRNETKTNKTKEQHHRQPTNMDNVIDLNSSAMSTASAISTIGLESTLTDRIGGNSLKKKKEKEN